MGADEKEDQDLRAAVLRNAESIHIARRRAEQALRDAHEALERKNEELQQQREWFQVTLSSIGDAVITTDVGGHVSFLNPVAEKMTGWSTSEAAGQPLATVFRIINEYTREPVENPVDRVLREGIVVGLANHTAIVRRDGSTTAIEDSAAPIRDLHGTLIGAVMVFHDVTDRRQAEAALREMDRRKDEFLATLAHELRNPLAPIRQAALISKAPHATEAQKRWSHDVISRQVQHMSLLLDDLLDVSRITRGTLELRLETTELADVIEAAVETARPLLDAKRHVFTVDRPPQPVRFMADPLRLAQVLSNLLTNAAKYTDAEGQIELHAEEASDAVVIRVKDNGIGIPAAATGDVFEMFAQVKSTQDRSEGGLGIGLALSKGLVELHGGKIEVRSEGSGRGSEFLVSLPRRAPGVTPVAKLSSVAVTAPVSRRVLIADDNRDAAESLGMLLRMDGHEVLIVHDGRAAAEAFTSFQPEVALLDIGMPELNGYEVARSVRQGSLGRAVTLIAITGWGKDSDKALALAAGFNHHFTKPIEPERLTEILRLLAPAGL